MTGLDTLSLTGWLAPCIHTGLLVLSKSYSGAGMKEGPLACTVNLLIS